MKYIISLKVHRSAFRKRGRMYTASGSTFGVFIFRFREEVGPKVILWKNRLLVPDLFLKSKTKRDYAVFLVFRYASHK